MNSSNNNNNNSINKTYSNESFLSIVEIKGIGNASLELANNNFIIRSHQSNYNYAKSLDKMDFLLYSNGNLIFNDKFFIGLAGEHFVINCKDNVNDFKIFYNNIKRIKANVKTENIPNNTLTNNVATTHIPNNNEVNKSENNADDSSINVSEEIRNFHNLMKEGIISEKEFEEKKKELLKL